MTAPTARAAKRDQVAAILETLPELGGRVHRARVWPVVLTDLPAAMVYGWRETKTRKTITADTHQFDVMCTMVIEVRLQAGNGEDAEAAAEDLAGAIETALLTAPGLFGLRGSIDRLDRFETQIRADATGETVIAAVSIGTDLCWTEVFQVSPADLPPPYLDAAVQLTPNPPL